MNPARTRLFAPENPAPSRGGHRRAWRCLATAAAAALFFPVAAPGADGEAEAPAVSFRRDVLPILTRAGCASGSCHAKTDGQNGFQLSIFSYDPRADHREIVHNARGRRVFPAAPEESLILLKATNTIPHEGEQRFEKGSEFYETIRSWIAQGMPYTLPGEPGLEKITVSPPDADYAKNATGQLTVTAHYSDASTCDVTRLAEFYAPDTAFAQVDEDGRISTGATAGQGVIVVRYIDAVDVSRITVPPDRILPDALYADLPAHNNIDTHAYARFRKLGILPSDLCSDSEFIRRATLDTIGRLPAPGRARAFLTDNSPGKREALVDELLSGKNAAAYADYWATKWGDLLRTNTQRIGIKPVYLFDQWIRERLRKNQPYDAFVRELLTAAGSTHEYGPVALWRDKRTPADMGEFASRIFLGVRIDCARCHHHPSEKWSQDDYYALAAFFASMKHKGQGISPPISGEPESWWFEPGGQVKHPVTGAVMSPKPPAGPECAAIPEETDPRSVFVDWMTAPGNPFFARAAANRVWGEFFGRGIVHPVDDFRTSNPATNESLLDWLASDFASHGYDLKHLIRTILTSRLYQLSSFPNETNIADTANFSRAYRRRLPAEVLNDAVADLTGSPDRFSGLPPGARAARTWNNLLQSDFLDAFGRPDSSAECPCERDASSSVVQVLHLMNSRTLQSRLADRTSWPAQLAGKEMDPAEIVDQVYLAAYARFPTADEKGVALDYFRENPEGVQLPTEDLLWSLLNSAEFVFNH